MRIINLDENIYLQKEDDFSTFESYIFHKLLSFKNYREQESGDELFFNYLKWMNNNFQLTKDLIDFDSLIEKLSDFLNEYYSDKNKYFEIENKGYYLLIRLCNKLNSLENLFLITGSFTEDEYTFKIPDNTSNSYVFDKFLIAREVRHQDRTYLSESYSEDGVIDSIAYSLNIEGYKIDSNSFNSYFNW